MKNTVGVHVAETISKVRTLLNFDKFSLLATDATNEEHESMSAFHISSRCMVKTHKAVKGSAFSGMSEAGLVAGYMRGNESLMVLVVYTERPDDLGGYDWGIVEFSQLRNFKEA